MIKSFLAKRKQKQQKRKEAFCNLQKLIVEIINKKFEVAADHGEIWHELDNLKQDFAYFDEKFFAFIENIEKLLIEFLRLQKKIHSETLHKRSAESLILKEKEVFNFLEKITLLEFVKINLGFKNELQTLITRIEYKSLTIK